MENIILFNPAISTLNTGDEIISESVIKHIRECFPDAFYTHISTHLPVSFRYLYYLSDCKYRFVCGTNLLKSDMLFGFRQWDISLLKAPLMGKSILVGCGWWQYQQRIDWYSRTLLKSVLSSEYIHSVRDAYTEEKLRKIGIDNVINTGCPTMWGFTKHYCECVPIQKAQKVITTLTDYKQSMVEDRFLLSTLSANYEEVLLWIQGYKDYEYYESIKDEAWKNVRIVPSGLLNYDRALEEDDVEYIGTRLHAGIRALQHKKRTLIVAVDNRALEKKKDFGLPVIKREEQNELLLNKIWDNRKTEILINEENIELFMKQFKQPNNR